MNQPQVKFDRFKAKYGMRLACIVCGKTAARGRVVYFRHGKIYCKICKAKVIT